MDQELGRRDAKRGALPRIGRWITLLVVGALGYAFWVKFEWSAPTARLARPLEFLGRESEIPLDVHDDGSGLAAVAAAIETAGGARFELLNETYPPASWRGSLVFDRSFRLRFSPRDAKIPEGPATLVVRATDGSWLNWLHERPPVLTQALTVDTTPPSVEVLTGQHYMRLGGSSMVIFRVSPDAVQSGVQVDRYFFPGTAGLLSDRQIIAALFAVPHDLTTAARPQVVATDRAGNRREADFFVSIKPRRFADRTLEVDDAFLGRKVPDLIQRNGLAPTDDLLAGYLTINRDLRRASEERIRQVCSRSEPKALWSEVFLRQPNSAPLSSFADHRTYTHGGKVIDSQTHLGYDLASLRGAEATAANRGKVVLADNLGIYGEAVILDHGLGVFTLYGHLGSIAVDVGDTVERGQTIGRTGETGLAAGDHLHFSTMLWGTHVDPVEWWDPKWIEDHITERIRSVASPAGGDGKPGRAG